MTQALQKQNIWRWALLAMCFTGFLLFIVPGSDIAFADKASDAAGMAGISSTGDNGKALIEEGKGYVYILMAFGFVIIAGCMIMAAIKLAASANGQKRAEALWWVGGAFIGAVISYNAFKLLGFAVGVGA